MSNAVRVSTVRGHTRRKHNREEIIMIKQKHEHTAHRTRHPSLHSFILISAQYFCNFNNLTFFFVSIACFHTNRLVAFHARCRLTLDGESWRNRFEISFEICITRFYARELTDHRWLRCTMHMTVASYRIARWLVSMRINGRSVSMTIRTYVRNLV